MWSVPRPRWLWVATGTASRIFSMSSSSKPCVSRRVRALPATSSWAHGHAVMPWAVTPISRRVPSSVHAAEPCSVYSSWVWMPADRGGLVLGEARLDADLGAAALLSRADELGDVLGQRLGLERRLAEDDLADRVVDDLLEPRHVRALLVGAELDHALEPRREQLLGAVLLDPDHLLDAGHADAREAQLDRRPAGLDVRYGNTRGVGSEAIALRYRVDTTSAYCGALARFPGHRRGLWYHSFPAHLGDIEREG